MAQIVNLRQARKKKQKAEHDARAEQNRIRFGRSKAERQRDKAIEDSATRLLDGHRLDQAHDE